MTVALIAIVLGLAGALILIYNGLVRARQRVRAGIDSGNAPKLAESGPAAFGVHMTEADVQSAGVRS